MNSRTPSLGVNNNWVLCNCSFDTLLKSRTKRRRRGGGGGGRRNGLNRHGSSPCEASEGIVFRDGNGFGSAGIVKGKGKNGSFKEEGKRARRIRRKGGEIGRNRH